MKRVLVTGVGGPAGRATAEFFRAGGYGVIGTDIRESNTPVDAFRFVPRGDDFRFGPALLTLLAQEHPDLLVPTVSEELPPIAAVKQKILTGGVLVCISELPTVLIANDKYQTALRLQSLGISVPGTLASHDVAGVAEAGRILGFPLLSKPRVGRGGRGVRVYHSARDVPETPDGDCIYQEFLPGEEYDVNLFAYPAGKVQAMATLLKTTLKGGLVGNALSVRRVSDRDVAHLAMSAAKELNFEGPIDIDVRRDRRGVPRILDVNARVGGNILSAKEVLVELRILLLERILHHAADFVHHP